jgi:ATP-dependent RNA helicase SUPV3L1/SUV3
VAFTAEMVYAVGELIRTQRGGAAVVLGALSPRTRNAQVALYQSGDVDYIVATDAIGMGLNMDVDHVAFAATRKFDGFQFRNLNAGELGQVAGRAGRYMNDGTFGVTGEVDPFDQEMIDRLENHNFDAVRMLQWRNRDLDFRTLDGLRKSLGYLPRMEGLTKAQDATDVRALESVLRDPSIHSLIKTPAQVLKAWEVCQIPDYRNISPAEHAHLVGRIISYLQTGNGYISEDWFAKQLAMTENLDGGIDALSTRISHVRSWTFIANRANWLEAPFYWQARAKDIENKLSDVLHEKLTQRFINRRSSVLMQRLARKEGLMTSVEDGGEVKVEGEFVGRIQGLHFTADNAELADARLLKTASLAAVTEEIGKRAKALAMTKDTDLKLLRSGEIMWAENAVGRVLAADHALRPRVDVLADDVLQGQNREEVRERLQKFVDRYIASMLEPLVKLEEAEGFEPLARGMAFRIVEHFGVLPRESVMEEVKALTQDDRAKLRGLGARFGAFHIFLPALLKPAATDLRLLLWWLQKTKAEAAAGQVSAPPANGLTSTLADPTKPQGFYAICGYRVCGKRAVRVDMLERLADLIRDRVFWKPRIAEEMRPAGAFEGGGFTVVSDMMSLVGCSGEEFEDILTNLGFRAQKKQIAKPLAAPAPTETPPLETAEPLPETSVEMAVETPLEMIDVNVWWPKDTGPFRKQPEKPKFVRPEKTTAPDGQKPKFKRREKHKPVRTDMPVRPPKPEKPLDPNSPFAALAALKAQMNQG